MGAFPQFSFIYPEIKRKLDQRAGNNYPMSRDGSGGVSGLTPWIRLISASGVNGGQDSNGGLILQSVYDKDGFTARYGNYEYKTASGTTIEQKSGILGYELDMKTPVTITGRPLRPSPIISSISIDEGDIGKRRTDFNIVAYTLEHMEKLAEYFLEPGFYVLLEWGWNTLSARSQWAGKQTGKVTPCEIASYHRWETIASKRQASNYDYDATLGVITGGGIQFGDNETYTLQVELTSIGEVAEYMQTHKDSTTSTTGESTKQKSGKIFSERQIKKYVEGEDNPAGKALFAQMVNKLPAAKQTSAIKNLINHPNKIFVDQSSYVNMDDVILDALLNNWRSGGGLVSTKSPEKLQVPSDEPIVSEERFIRFELATEILQNYSAELSQDRKLDTGCPDNKASLKINVNDCICGAFPHMFSTDKTKLYIPNTQSPEFGFQQAFSGKEAETDFIFDSNGTISKTLNLHPNTVFGYYDGTRLKNGMKTPHAFPSTYELTKEDNPINKTDKTFVPYLAPKGWWGWLKNLYINFDFFVEVLQTPNYTVRDVLHDLLNGMSGAVNSLWKFQIMERNINDYTELYVVDLNFSGDCSEVGNSSEIKTFQSRGVKSPFVDSQFAVTVPASTMNSTIQKRLSNDKNRDPNPDVNPKPILGIVFSNNKDAVGTIVSGIQYKDVEEDEDGNVQESPAPPTEDEIRLANYEFFLGKAGVFPKIQYRTDRDDVIQGFLDWDSGNDASLEDVMMVGTWADTTALQQVLNYDKGNDIQLNKGGKKGEETLNAPYGMARFDFKVHGISGFKRGDVFRVDGLPRNFGKPHFFQIDSLNHSIDSGGWYVEVSAGLRPFGKNDNIDE